MLGEAFANDFFAVRENRFHVSSEPQCVHQLAERAEGQRVLNVVEHGGSLAPRDELVTVAPAFVGSAKLRVDETVRRHKPAPEAYHSVAAALAVSPGDICLIASHVWDTIGAGAAGWQAALILREGNAPLDVGPQPDYIGKDLDAIADQLIERYAAASKDG